MKGEKGIIPARMAFNPQTIGNHMRFRGKGHGSGVQGTNKAHCSWLIAQGSPDTINSLPRYDSSRGGRLRSEFIFKPHSCHGSGYHISCKYVENNIAFRHATPRPKQVRLHRQTTSSLFYQRPHLSITPPQVPQLSAASPAASSAGLPLIYIQKRLWVFWYRAEHILQ